LRLEITTLAPRRAIASALARPMPRLEPVMMATLPSRAKGDPCIAGAARSPGIVFPGVILPIVMALPNDPSWDSLFTPPSLRA
jgi:hypothetical protein